MTRCDAWSRLWEEIKTARPSLVIVDPVSAALADADTSQTGPARTFLRLLSQEAATAGCGVLLVAHDTKSARNLAMAGQDPGAGAVAGSAAWYDGARGVLTLVPDPAARGSPTSEVRLATQTSPLMSIMLIFFGGYYVQPTLGSGTEKRPRCRLDMAPRRPPSDHIPGLIEAKQTK